MGMEDALSTLAMPKKYKTSLNFDIYFLLLANRLPAFLLLISRKAHHARPK
jgi:hypothetical protein